MVKVFQLHMGTYSPQVILVGIIGIVTFLLNACNHKEVTETYNSHKEISSLCDVSLFGDFIENKNIQSLVKHCDSATQKYVDQNFPEDLPNLKNDYSILLLKETDSICQFQIGNLVYQIGQSNNKLILTEGQLLSLLGSEHEICYQIGLFQWQNKNIEMAKMWLIQSAFNGSQKATDLINDNPDLW